MRKKIVLSGIAATALFTLIGCGGGDESSSSTTGKAYYLDSAIAGIDYRCGTHVGTTDKEGAFIFEKGKTCLFSLDDIPLKNLDTTNLKNGEKIVEDNPKIAAVLQTLDIDGNPDNGITITKEIKEALKKEKSTLEAIIDSNNPDINQILNTISMQLKKELKVYKGHAVDPEQAEKHLAKTKKLVQEERIKKLLAGKTFYVVGREENGGIWYDKATFDSNLSSLQWKGLAGEDEGESGSESIKLDGNKIIWLKDNSYTVVGPMKEGYIELIDYESDGTVESHTRLYSDKSKADAYFKSFESGTFKFTPDYLNGKTFYYVKYDDFGYDDIGVKWNMAKIHFNKDTFTWTEYNTPDTGTYTFHYEVTKDGTIKYQDENATDDAGTGTIYNPQLENDRIEVCVDDGGSTDCDTYLFFDEAKAEEFVKKHNSGTSDDKGDEDYVTHGKTTGVVTYHPDVAQIDKVEFDTATNELKIYFNQPMTWGTNTLTTGDYVPDTKAGGFGKDGKLFVMKFKSYKPKGIINFSAGYFKSQNDGQGTKAFSITFPE